MYDFVPFSNIYFSTINYNFISFENSEKKKKKKKNVRSWKLSLNSVQNFRSNWKFQNKVILSNYLLICLKFIPNDYSTNNKLSKHRFYPQFFLIVKKFHLSIARKSYKFHCWRIRIEVWIKGKKLERRVHVDKNFEKEYWKRCEAWNSWKYKVEYSENNRGSSVNQACFNGEAAMVPRHACCLINSFSSGPVKFNRATAGWF